MTRPNPTTCGGRRVDERSEGGGGFEGQWRPPYLGNLDHDGVLALVRGVGVGVGVGVLVGLRGAQVDDLGLARDVFEDERAHLGVDGEGGRVREQMHDGLHALRTLTPARGRQLRRARPSSESLL